MIRRFVTAVPAALLALSLGPSAARAQSAPGARRDSVPVSFGVWRPRSTLGASAGTVDSASGRASPAAPPRTLSELLTARVAGLSVTRTSGTSGAAARLRVRGRNTIFGAAEPMVVVDGIVASGEEPGVDSLLGGVRTSRLDEIAPEDVERVDLLRGPAAAALYGANASNGVLVITTRRAAPGSRRVQSFAETGAVDPVPNFGASYWRFGQNPASGRAWDCAIDQVAAGACTPDSLVRWAPFAGTGVFGVAPRVAAGASAQWGSSAVAYRVSGRYENEHGALAPNALRRLGGRASVTARPSRTVDLSVTGGALRGSTDLPAERDILLRYLIRPPAGTIPFELRERPLAYYDTPITQDSRRITWGARAGWQPREWLQTFASYGRDQTAHDESRAVRYRLEATSPYVPAADFFERRRRDGDAGYATAALGAAATFRPRPSLESVTLVGAHRVRRRTSRHTADSTGTVFADDNFGDAWGVSRSGQWDRLVALGVYAQQRLAWRDRVSLGASLLRAASRNEYAKPLDSEGYFPSADFTWTLRNADASAAREYPWLGSVRLRAATGEAPHALTGSELRDALPRSLVYQDPPARSTAEWMFERTRESELGVAAELFAERAHLELTGYRSEVRDLFLVSAVAIGQRRGDDSFGARTSGFEAQLAASLVERPRLRWDAALAVTLRRERMLGPSVDAGSESGWGVVEQAMEGYPTAGIWVRPYSYADANGDGIVDAASVTVAPPFEYRGPVDPTREASLQTSVRLLRRVELSALLDHRGGHSRVNGTEAQRCWWRTCQAIQDPAAPLAEQARAVISAYGGFVERASFTKLREVALAVDAPARWATALGASSLRLTVAGRNLVTWTNYSGADPEVGDGGTLFPESVDLFTQPLPRYVTARLSASW